MNRVHEECAHEQEAFIRELGSIGLDSTTLNSICNVGNPEVIALPRRPAMAGVHPVNSAEVWLCRPLMATRGRAVFS